MQLFDCKVRLGGSVMNEVRREGVSAAEVLVLRHIHGPDAVVDLVLVGEEDRADAEERDRLLAAYNPAFVVELFGPDHRELPNALPEFKKGKAVKASRVPAAVDFEPVAG